MDDLDKELEKRGLPFVRYADDFVIFTKTEVAAHRVYASVERFITTKLKLIVNHDKSRVRCADGIELVGYKFRGYGGQIRVSRKKLDAFKQRYAEFRSYAMGWLGYFALDQVQTTFTNLDKWLRRRVRACYWKQWRKSQTRLKKLISYGVSCRSRFCDERQGCLASFHDVWRPTSLIERSAGRRGPV